MKKSRSLTDAESRMIQSCVHYKCEISGCLYGESQEVHHIKERSNGGQNTYFNLICVCASHHKEASQNKITSDELRDYIKQRNIKDENCIKRVLKKINKNKKSEVDINDYPFKSINNFFNNLEEGTELIR